MPVPEDEREPGYCESCREFHLLTRVEVPALDGYADVCGNCAARGPELAWRLAGIAEDGEYGYELEPDEFTRAARGTEFRKMTRGPAVRRRDRLAESLAADEGRADESGFKAGVIPRLGRAWLLWQRLRGRPYRD